MEMDNFDEGVVRRTIKAMYVQKTVLPTLKNIRDALQQKIGYSGSKSTLRKQLKSIGFNYRRCQMNRKVLMERSDIVLHMIQYLRRIKELREAGTQMKPSSTITMQFRSVGRTVVLG